MQGGMKNSRFLTNTSLCLANDTRLLITMEGEYETAPKLSNGAGDLE